MVRSSHALGGRAAAAIQRDTARIAARRAAAAAERHWHDRMENLDQRANEALARSSAADERVIAAEERVAAAEERARTAEERAGKAEEMSVEWRRQYEGLRARLEAFLRRFWILRFARLVPSPLRRFAAREVAEVGTPVKVLSETGLIPVRETDESDLLAVSALMDETSYRNQASLSHDVDPAAHYLREGWLQGLNPFEGFDGEFLRPYYEASNLHGPPAVEVARTVGHAWSTPANNQVRSRNSREPRSHLFHFRRRNLCAKAA